MAAVATVQVLSVVTSFASSSPGSSPSRALLSVRNVPDENFAPRTCTSAVRLPPSTTQSISFSSPGHRRLRRRGPRSFPSRERRAQRWDPASSGARVAEPRAAPFGEPDGVSSTLPRATSASASRSPSCTITPSLDSVSVGKVSIANRL